MIPATTTTPSRNLRRRLGVATGAGLLAATGLAWAGAPARADQGLVEPTAQAATSGALPDSCRLVDHYETTFVECVVTDSGEVTIDGLVPDDLAPREGASVVLTARGGSGATLGGDAGGRSGGAGGIARTSVAADDLETLYVHVGQDARRGSREGGSSTIVSPLPVEDVRSIDDTYLVAGGGGAQGSTIRCLYRSRHIWEGAGDGGNGGFADANHRSNGQPVSGDGADGGAGLVRYCSGKSTGHAGSGGDRGVAGTNAGDPRSNGTDGVGGKGGVNGWQGGVAADHEAGRGGITGVYAMGGGGWGGGGGGERNGGGGGGGSYAKAGSEWVNVYRSYPTTPSVTLAWPL